MRPLAKAAWASHLLPVAALAAPALRWEALLAWGVAQAGIALEILRPGSRSFAANIRRAPEAVDRIAITFDDGPRENETGPLLDALAAARARASFFLVGRRAKALPALVRRIAAGGHTIGNHTLSHPKHWSLLPRGRALREVGEAQAILAEITGRAPSFFRPPMGHKNLHLDEILMAHALKQVTWSVRSFDTLTRDAGAVLRRVGPRLRGGEIVLLHEGLKEKRRGTPLSVELVAPLVSALRERRLQPVSLEALLSAPPAAPTTAPP